MNAHAASTLRAIGAHVKTPALRGLLPARLARTADAGEAGAWLLLYAGARLAATVIAAALVAWAGVRHVDVLRAAQHASARRRPGPPPGPGRLARRLQRDARVRGGVGRLSQPVLPAVAREPRV